MGVLFTGASAHLRYFLLWECFFDKFAVLMIVIPGKKLTCHSSHCVRCSGVYQSQARLAIRICQGLFGTVSRWSQRSFDSHRFAQPQLTLRSPFRSPLFPSLSVSLTVAHPSPGVPSWIPGVPLCAYLPISPEVPIGPFEMCFLGAMLPPLSPETISTLSGLIGGYQAGFFDGAREKGSR